MLMIIRCKGWVPWCLWDK